jgi:two-component system sensor histidine kinase HydH
VGLTTTQRAGMMEIEVTDTGLGILPELLPRLFEPFVTGKDTGTGLGLVVCKRIAEDHGGTITGRNRTEGGAAFTLRLPVG